MTELQAHHGYPQLLTQLKERIRSAQVKASLSVNRELIQLYWDIGQAILARQEAEGWGSKVIETLSKDLLQAFPEMKGFSIRNLKYMRAFAEAYPTLEIVQQAAAQIPWTHNCQIMDKVKEPQARLWYIAQTVENGWSRNVLVHQIESGLYERQALSEKTHNFPATLPSPQGELANQLLKDPYSFDFLTLGQDAKERDIEQSLMSHITRFLLELGKGFAFLGRQVPLEVSGTPYFLDLLFYHTRLKCYVVIELKAGAFKPEYAGKLNFYLSAVDEQMKDPTDNPTIGLMLCKEKDRVTAEYALRNLTSPISVNEYQLSHTLPKELEPGLPSIEALEREASTLELPEPGDEDSPATT